MSIEDYIKKYQDIPFLVSEFNEIDNIILSMIAYIDFDGILDVDKALPLKEAAKLFFKRYEKQEIKASFYTTKYAIELLSLIKDTIRYSSLILYNYVYIRTESEQFSALFIDINEHLTYISFEGTDELISGWYEDAALSYEFPVPAQKDAIDYINKNIKLFDKRRYIIGGHSKGGNLALVSSMYLSILKKHKIIKIYSNDGPGLGNIEFNSRRYKNIEKKYQLIIPKYSIVGLLFNNKKGKKIVDTSIRGPLTHCAKFWIVDDNHFKTCNLTPFSIKMDKTIKSWLDNYDIEERKLFVKDILNILKKCNIESLTDIRDYKLKSFFNILKESKKLDKKSKAIIVSLLKIYIGNVIKVD